jgi:hypothetical protein
MPQPKNLLARALVALSLLQILNVAVFDDLRVDEGATWQHAFSKPQHVAGILAPLVALYLLRRGSVWGLRLATLAGAGTILGFAWFHLTPTDAGGMQPYWDGGDALQWLGLILNCVCASVVLAASQRSMRTALG